MAKATTKKTTPKRATTRTVASGDQAPETKRTAKAQSAAADKLFADADKAALAGFPPDLTVEQHENMARKNALGY